MSNHVAHRPLAQETIAAVRERLRSELDDLCAEHVGMPYEKVTRSRSPEKRAELLREWNAARCQLAMSVEPEADYVLAMKAAKHGLMRTARGVKVVEEAALTWHELAALWPVNITSQGIAQLYRRACKRQNIDPEVV